MDHSTKYYIRLKVFDEAFNGSGLSNELQASTQAATTVFQDDIESGPGGWTAAGSPGLWHISQRRATSPGNAWYYGMEILGNYDTFSANSGTLTSEAIDLTQVTEAELFFNEWSEVEHLGDWDRTRVQISTDASTWTTVFESHGTSGVWAGRSVDLTPYAGGFIYLRFFFDTMDNLYNNFEGWYVDDVLVLAIGANSPPVAADDGYSVDEDAVLVIGAPGVLANDTDPETDPLSAILVSGAGNGALSLNANGSFIYTPDQDFNGSDSFAYKASDGFADSNTVTVSIAVTPVNDAPEADGDSYSTGEDTQLVVAAAGVLANDTDLDGDSLTAVLETGPSNGWLSLDPDGSFIYTPDGGFSGSDGFTYHASDSSTNSNVVTASIIVTAGNNPPVAADDGYSVDEDAMLTVSAPGVLANDSDPDGDPIIVSLLTNVSHGLLDLNADGSFTYTPNTNFNGADSFTYAADAGSASDQATVNITVNAVNDAPVAADDTDAVAEGGSINVDVRANDTDEEDGMPSVTVVITTPALNGTATVNEDGTVKYIYDGSETTGDMFKYTVKDSDGAPSNEATVSITVNPVNDAPLAHPGGPYVGAAAVALAFCGSGSSDPEGSALTYAWDFGDGKTGTGVSSSHTYAAAGVYTVTLLVDDGTDDSASVTTTEQLPLHRRHKTRAGGVATPKDTRHSTHGPGSQKGGEEQQTAGKTTAGQRARPVHEMPARTRQTKQGPLRTVL